MRHIKVIGLVALTLGVFGCQKDAGESQMPVVPTSGGSIGVDWPLQDLPPSIARAKRHHPPTSGDFGGECSQPDGCTSDSADWPDCLNVQCSTGDCAYPIFTLDYGYCAATALMTPSVRTQSTAHTGASSSALLMA